MYFAYFLQDRNDHLQVTDMKGRQGQSDMSEMAIALLERESTCLTETSLVRYAHAPIKRSIVPGNPVPIEVV